MRLLKMTRLLTADETHILDGGEGRGRRVVEPRGRVAGLDGHVGLSVDVAVGELVGVGVVVIVRYLLI